MIVGTSLGHTGGTLDKLCSIPGYRPYLELDEFKNIVKEKNVTHMEAVLLHCKEQGIEPDTVSNLLSKGLKEKIEANARDLNFLPKQARLPI